MFHVNAQVFDFLFTAFNLKEITLNVYMTVYNRRNNPALLVTRSRVHNLNWTPNNNNSKFVNQSSKNLVSVGSLL